MFISITPPTQTTPRWKLVILDFADDGKLHDAVRQHLPLAEVDVEGSVLVVWYPDTIPHVIGFASLLKQLETLRSSAIPA